MFGKFSQSFDIWSPFLVFHKLMMMQVFILKTIISNIWHIDIYIYIYIDIDIYLSKNTCPHTKHVLLQNT